MGDDKDNKCDHHHLDCFSSCADTEHQSGNCDQEYQPGKQVEYDGRKLREEDTDPLYQGNCHNDGHCQQFM